MIKIGYHPWSERQGKSGFAWSWLGASLQATSLSFGVVNAPGQRYHPAIIAQAAATLAELFPDRFWMAVGASKPMFSKVQLSYHPDQRQAEQGAFDQWKGNVFPNSVMTELRMPAQFDDASSMVDPAAVTKFVQVSAELNQHADWLLGYCSLGFSQVSLHNVNRHQASLINDFGSHVLPQLTSAPA